MRLCVTYEIRYVAHTLHLRLARRSQRGNSRDTSRFTHRLLTTYAVPRLVRLVLAAASPALYICEYDMTTHHRAPPGGDAPSASPFRFGAAPPRAASRPVPDPSSTCGLRLAAHHPIWVVPLARLRPHGTCRGERTAPPQAKTQCMPMRAVRRIPRSRRPTSAHP